MTYDRLREWFDSFDGDPFTVAVVGALVDIAESARGVFDGQQSTDEGLSQDVREAVAALEDLETALDDANDSDGVDQYLERRLAS